MPDGLEFRFGTDPTVEDMLVDADFDGRLNGDEIRAGTAPALFDEESAILDQMLFSISPQDPNPDETRCYDFRFQGITLVPTLAVDGGEKGVNRIFVARKRSRRACGRSASRRSRASRCATSARPTRPAVGVVRMWITYFVPYEDMNIGADCWNVEDAAAAVHRVHEPLLHAGAHDGTRPGGVLEGLAQGPPEPPDPVIDDKVEIDGRSTQSPEDLVFPLRVLFLVDCSSRWR
jgi:hypothetical protein